MLKAAIAFKNSKLGIPILVGKEELIKNQIKKLVIMKILILKL